MLGSPELAEDMLHHSDLRSVSDWGTERTYELAQVSLCSRALRYELQAESALDVFASTKHDLRPPERAVVPVVGDSEKEQALRDSIRLDPGRAEAFNHLGNTLRSQGRLQEAELMLRRALELDPSHPAAAYNLQRLLNDLNRDHDAEHVSDAMQDRFQREEGVVGGRWRDYGHLKRFYDQYLGNDGCGV